MSIGKLSNKEVIQLYDAKHGLICRFCLTKFLDPDKTKHQIYISDRCTTCGKHPDEERKREQEEKREAKRARKQAHRHHIKHQNKNKSKRR